MDHVNPHMPYGKHNKTKHNKTQYHYYHYATITIIFIIIIKITVYHSSIHRAASLRHVSKLHGCGDQLPFEYKDSILAV